jgi:prolipoprotein diacylglyceryltransferase
MLSPLLHIKILNRKVQSFHFFGITGYILGTSLGVILAKHLNLDPKIVLLMSGIGAATFFLLAVLAKMITGKETIVYYHHEIAILVICFLVLKLLDLPVLNYLDITILGIATFLAFGRIGCFSVGCCHGQPAKHGVVYGHEHVEAGFTFYYEGISLFPIQLIESLFVFLLIITGSMLLAQNFPPGTVLVLYTVVYGAFRFGVEFFRGDAERPYRQGLSEAQWTTLVLVILSLAPGLAGVIPLYNWHIIVTTSLLTTAFFVVLGNDTKQKIFNPRHIRQIACILSELDNDTNKMNYEDPAGSGINVIHTDLGLCFSKGIFLNEKGLTTHYTVSNINKLRMDYSTVKRLASLIKILQKQNTAIRVEEKQYGIFHILFYNPIKSENKLNSERL